MFKLSKFVALIVISASSLTSFAQTRHYTHNGLSYELTSLGQPLVHPDSTFVELSPWVDVMKTFVFIGFEQPPNSPPNTYGPAVNFLGSSAGSPNISFVSKTHGMLAETASPYFSPPEWAVGQVTLFGNWEWISAIPASNTRWRISHPVYPVSYEYTHVWENGGGFEIGTGFYFGHVKGLYATSAEAYEVTDKN